MKYVALILLCFNLTACIGASDLDITGMPHPPTQGPPNYILGWKHGCETGMTAYSSFYLRARYKTRVDGKMMTNNDYNKGWRLGNRYCNYYTSRYLSLGVLDNVGFAKKDDLRDNNQWFTLNDDLDIFKLWRIKAH